MVKSLQFVNENKINSSFSIEIIENDNFNISHKFHSKEHYSVYYQSNNVYVKLRSHVPSGKKALLVSSHFDSVSASHGVTDAGIAITCMIETIRSLIYSTKALSHDVIFAFTNGEEMYLQGSSAAIFHPWFKGIGAFVNLEGTGAASEGSRSILFRTNSMRLTRIFTKAPNSYPHASIILNDIMQFIKSETDFRRYSMIAPGLDVAFYTFRLFAVEVLVIIDTCTTLLKTIWNKPRFSQYSKWETIC